MIHNMNKIYKSLCLIHYYFNKENYLSFFSRLETFAYKHVFVPRQGKHTFDFIGRFIFKR